MNKYQHEKINEIEIMCKRISRILFFQRKIMFACFCAFFGFLFKENEYIKIQKYHIGVLGRSKIEEMRKMGERYPTKKIVPHSKTLENQLIANLKNMTTRHRGVGKIKLNFNAIDESQKIAKKSLKDILAQKSKSSERWQQKSRA